MTFLDGPGIGTSGGCENEGEVGADGVVDIIAWNAGPDISLGIFKWKETQGLRLTTCPLLDLLVPAYTWDVPDKDGNDRFDLFKP
jgi:hypothetical protein